VNSTDGLPNAVSRRTLIAGAAVAAPAAAVLNASSAWAKPVVASLNGMPAFVSSGATTTVSGNAIVLTSFGVEGNQVQQQAYLNVHFSCYYQPYNFPNAQSGASLPGSLVTTYTIKIKDTNGEVVYTASASLTVKTDGASYSAHLPDSAPFLNKNETYTVTLSLVTPTVTVAGINYEVTTTNAGPLSATA
jgi:hypothetical protein